MEGVAFHGSCLCENIKFIVSGPPEKVFSCYCIDCSKNAGGPYQLSARFDRSQVEMHAGAENFQTTYVIQETISGAAKHKVFCRECGCTLWTIPMKHQGEKLIVRTSLIDGGLEQWKPSAEFYAPMKPSVLSGNLEVWNMYRVNGLESDETLDNRDFANRQIVNLSNLPRFQYFKTFIDRVGK